MTTFVCRVTGNLKGSCDLEVGEKTLLWGVNGAGKSRIVNTIELALSGYASDITGRPSMSQGSSLIDMAAPGEDLKARVVLSTGGSAFFQVERNGPYKTRKPLHSPPEGVTVAYPLTVALKALRGSVETAERFLLTYSGLDVSDDAIAGRLPSSQRGAYSTFLAAQQDSGIGALLAITTNAKTAATAASRRVRDAEGLLEVLGKNAPALQPTTEALEEHKAGLLEMTKTHARASVQRNVARPDVAVYRRSAEEWIKTLKDAEASLGTVRASYLSFCAEQGLDPEGLKEPQDVALRAALAVLLDAYEGQAQATDSRGAPCVLCRNGEVRLDAAMLQGRHVKLIEANTVHEQHSDLQRRVRIAEQKAARSLQSAEAAVKVYRDMEDTTKRMAMSSYPDAAFARLESDLEAAQDEYQRLLAAHSMWGELQKARDTRDDARHAAREAKDLAVACKEVISALVEEGRTLFAERVQAYLPEGDQFGLLLSGEGRSRCSFGLMRAGQLHSALSGAEWARLTLALGASICPTGPDVLAILTPEERAFDAATLRRVMVALTDAPGQVILTSPIKPKGRTPKGWTVIEIGGATADAHL